MAFEPVEVPEKASEPPAHLSPASKIWFRAVVSEFVLDSHHVQVLTVACEAWDRKEQARKLIKRHGLVAANRFGELRANPAVTMERDSRTAFLRAVRELDLDIEPPPEIARLRGRR